MSLGQRSVGSCQGGRGRVELLAGPAVRDERAEQPVAVQVLGAVHVQEGGAAGADDELDEGIRNLDP